MKFFDSLLKIYYYQEPQANKINLFIKTCIKAIILAGKCGEGEEGGGVGFQMQATPNKSRKIWI